MTTKKYYAWVGQNASCGLPNPVTGRMSMYGTNYVFENKSDRDEFVDGYHSDNPSVYCVSCTLRQLRAKNLGCSVRDFEDDLAYRRMVKLDDGTFEYLCFISE